MNRVFISPKVLQLIITQEMAHQKSINRMTKAELLEEVRRLKGEMKDLMDSTQNLVDPSQLIDSEEILKLEAERDEWMEKSMTLEELMEKKDAEISKQEAFREEAEEKYKSERKSWNKQTKSLNSQLKELKSQIDKQKTEHEVPINSLHKASFRLDFYKQDEGEELKGKIEHLTSRKKKNFSGVNHKLIQEFLQAQLAHLLPASPEKESDSKISANTESKPKKTEKKKRSQAPFVQGKLEFQLESGEKRSVSNLLNRRENTIVNIPLNTSVLDIESEEYQWQASLFSTSMRTRDKVVMLGKYEGVIQEESHIEIKIPGLHMPKGPNRVNASVNLYKRENDGFIRQASYDVSGLAYVE